MGPGAVNILYSICYPMKQAKSIPNTDPGTSSPGKPNRNTNRVFTRVFAAKMQYKKISDQSLLGEGVNRLNIFNQMLLKGKPSGQMMITTSVWISDLGEAITGPVEIKTQAPLTRFSQFIKKDRQGELYAA